MMLNHTTLLAPIYPQENQPFPEISRLDRPVREKKARLMRKIDRQ